MGAGPDGEPGTGSAGWCCPRAPGRADRWCSSSAFPDEESEHEHLALRHWDGRGAVQLLRADPHRRALLLDRLRPEDLTEIWDLEACEVVAGLYAAACTGRRRPSSAGSRR